jgi:hypothetical protein
MPPTPRDEDPDLDPNHRHQQQRPRKGHRYNNSNGDIAKPRPHRHHDHRDTESTSPRRKERKRYHHREEEYTTSNESASKSSTNKNTLSVHALEQLDALNTQRNINWNSNGGIQDTRDTRRQETEQERQQRRQRREQRKRERGHEHHNHGQQQVKERRVASGNHLERGNGSHDEKVVLVDDRKVNLRGGAGSVEYEHDEARRKRRRKIGEFLIPIKKRQVSNGTTQVSSVLSFSSYWQ